MNAASISVAVCSKNRSEELRNLAVQLRKIIQKQNAKKVELVIVEDVTEIPDELRPSRIKEADIYAAVQYEHGGFGAIRQRAVELACGELIAFIDDDCTPCDGWLDFLIAPFSDPQVVAVGGGILPQKGNMIAKATALIGLPAGGLPRLMASHGKVQVSDFLSTGNLALRRSAVFTAGGFDTRHRFGGEDQQLVAKLMGEKRFVPTALVKHRNRQLFSEVWAWFVRRGMGEYRLNRLSGLGKFQSTFQPWRWSWTWRILLFVLIGSFIGLPALLVLLASYYAALFVKIFFANRGDSSIPSVMHSKSDCLCFSVILLAPVLRVWMDIAREYGRIKSVCQHER